MKSLLSLIVLAGCASDSSDSVEDTADTSALVPAETSADRATEYLIGDFNSEEQSKSNPSYYAISLRSCPVDFPDMGDRVLYVEQASMDSLTAPYRQRLYVVEDLSDGRVSSEIYAFTDSKAAKLVGACDAPEEITIKTKHLEERTGCTVWLEEQEDGSFEGSTEGTECSSSIGGAAYATSVVTLKTDRLLSLDQGWDANGNQVWGAVDGPYRFMRQ